MERFERDQTKVKVEKKNFWRISLEAGTTQLILLDSILTVWIYDFIEKNIDYPISIRIKYMNGNEIRIKELTNTECQDFCLKLYGEGWFKYDYSMESHDRESINERYIKPLSHGGFEPSPTIKKVRTK